MKDYYKFFKSHCAKKTSPKGIQNQIKTFCGTSTKGPITGQWVQPFCMILKKKIDDLTLHYKNLSKNDLFQLVSKLDKSIKKNATKEFLIAKLLFSLQNCRNQFTVYGDKISQIHPDKLFVTSSGYCHDIDELMTYIISTGGDKNVEPHDDTNTITIWQNLTEKNKIVKHKYLDPSLKKEYTEIQEAKNKIEIPIPIPRLQHLLDIIAYLAFICLNDHPSSFQDGNFKTAEEALGYFSEVIQKCTAEEQQLVYGLKNGGGVSFKSLLEDNAMCIHMKGDHILNIYLYNYCRFKKSNIDVYLAAFVIEIEKCKIYGTVRFYENQLQKFSKNAQIRYIISYYNDMKDQFMQIDRNYMGFYKKYPILKSTLSETIVKSIEDALSFFKIK